jgi:hypothetical protein
MPSAVSPPMDDRTAIRVRRLAAGMLVAGIVGTVLSLWISHTHASPKEIVNAIEAAFGFQ